MLFVNHHFLVLMLIRNGELSVKASQNGRETHSSNHSLSGLKNQCCCQNAKNLSLFISTKFILPNLCDWNERLLTRTSLAALFSSVSRTEHSSLRCDRVFNVAFWAQLLTLKKSFHCFWFNEQSCIDPVNRCVNPQIRFAFSGSPHWIPHDHCFQCEQSQLKYSKRVTF